MAQPNNQFLPNDGGGSGGTGSGGSGTGGGAGVPGSNSSVIQNTFVVNSGLFDVTATQYPIQFDPGIPNRVFIYTGPTILLTDTLSGSITLLSAVGAGTPVTATIALSHATLPQWVTAIKAAFGAHVVPSIVQIGTTGYLVLQSPSSVIAPGSATDTTLTISALSITDDADPNLNFQFVPRITPGLGLQSTGVYQWALGIRDLITGHISNMSPVAQVSTLLYPSEANLSLQAAKHYELSNQAVEVYRTAANGTSLLYLGEAVFNTGNIYSFRDTYNDNFLNPGIVGPIAEANDPPPQGMFGMVNHSGSLWGIVGNKVYFSGGQDTNNGSGNEAWPPSNFFAFPGAVVSLLPTSSGLMVFLKDDIHVIRGVDSSSYFPDLWLAGFGVSNPLAAIYDGQTLYLYTTKQQLHALSPNAQKEIGFDIGDVLAAQFPAAATNLTLHRGSSLDYALYVSNGSGKILRYDPRQKAWSPISQPVMGAGRVKSLETTTGVNTLLLGAGSAIFKRVLGVWTDNGISYPAFASIGTMMVAEPGTVSKFSLVAVQTKAAGSLPSVSVLNNEIDATVVPFTALHRPVNDPPELADSLTLRSKRWYLKSSQTPLPMDVNTIQVKVAFPAEDAANEVLGVYLRRDA